jgi:HSP20 family protein
MIRWDPWGELASLHNTMDRVFGEAYGQSDKVPRERPSLHLPVNIKETEADYRIQAPVPGFPPEQIEVTFTEGMLTIRAQHPGEPAAEEGVYIRRELARGNLVRQIGLPGQVQEADIKASVENGLLEVTVPKEPRAQPKRISVSGTGESKQLT